MNARLPGLVVELEAKIDKLERGLAKANTAQRRSARTMERRAAQSADRINASYGRMTSGVAAKFAKMAVPLAAGIASAGTARAIADTTKQIASLGDEAKRAGVPLEALQEWRFVAEQNRIPVDALVDGFKELSLRADELILTGKGPAAEAFGRLGYGAEELAEKLKDPSELLLEIMGRMRRLDVAARIRIADELFGGSGGERFVELVDQGEDGLRRTVRRAHEVGAVLSSDVVKRADEIDRRFGEIATKVSRIGKGLAVGITDVLVEMSDFSTALKDIFETPERARAILGDAVADQLARDTGAVEDHADALHGLNGDYRDLARRADTTASELERAAVLMRGWGMDEAADDLVAATSRMRDLSRQMDDGTISADEFERQLNDAAEKAKTALDRLTDVDRVEFSGVIAAVGGLAQALATAISRAETLREALPSDPEAALTYGPTSRRGHRAGSAPRTSLRPRAAPPMIHERTEEPSDSGGGGGSRKDEYAREVAAIREEAIALKLEAAALVATAAAGETYAGAIEAARREAELLHAAQKQGREITPALRAEIAALADQYGEAAQAAQHAEDGLDRLAEAKAEIKNVAGDAFSDLITGARDLDDVLGDVIGRLAEMAANRAFESIWTGTGGTAQTGTGGTNWIATLVSAFLGFDRGGYTGDGGKHEPAGIVHKGEFVLSADATRRIGVRNLQALHEAARRGYSGGGYVGSRTPLEPISAGRTESLRVSGAGITINAPVTVNASGGSPEQNADLAKEISKEMEANMRGVVVKEIRAQMRPGNMLASRKG